MGKRKTIIYFYPKDNTSGCTAEACSFRDHYAELTAAGYNVVGVSKDSAKSHTGFRARHVWNTEPGRVGFPGRSRNQRAHQTRKPRQG